MNVHKTFRRCTGRFLNILYTFNLHFFTNSEYDCDWLLWDGNETSMGRLGYLPNIKQPVAQFVLELYAQINRRHLVLWLVSRQFNMLITVWFILSTLSLVWGWYGLFLAWTYPTQSIKELSYIKENLLTFKVFLSVAWKFREIRYILIIQAERNSRKNY